MKVYFCFAAILSAFILVQCHIVIPPEIESKLKECRNEFGLSKESLKSPDFEDPKIKCYAACFLKKDDRLEGGKVSMEKEVQAALKYIEKGKIDDSFKDKITGCVNEANEEKEECNVGGVLFKCVVENFGPLPDMKE